MTPRQRSDALLADRTWRQATADVRASLKVVASVAGLMRATLDAGQARQLLTALEAMAAELDAYRAAAAPEPVPAAYKEEEDHCRALAASAPPAIIPGWWHKGRWSRPRLP